jgi:mucin-5B
MMMHGTMNVNSVGLFCFHLCWSRRLPLGRAMFCLSVGMYLCNSGKWVPFVSNKRYAHLYLQYTAIHCNCMHSYDFSCFSLWLMAIHCIPYTVFHTLYSIYCIPYTVFHILYSIYCIPYTVFHILYSIYCIPYTVFHTLYSIYCIPYTVYYTLYSIHCIPYTQSEQLSFTFSDFFFHAVPIKTNSHTHTTELMLLLSRIISTAVSFDALLENVNKICQKSRDVFFYF